MEELHQLFLASSGVTTDTRNIGASQIFFALKGDKFNANQFATEALDKGAGFAIVDEDIPLSEKYGKRLIRVNNVLQTLQQLAGYHRKLLKCPVLAITGSNGKTTTKELIAAVMSTTFKTVATKGNLNNHIGVPLTLLSMPLDTAFAIVEMGANHQKEIEGYCEYARPDYGLITNIGKAHLEGFGGLEGVFKGKTELFRFLSENSGKVFVYDHDDRLKTFSHQLFSRDAMMFYGTGTDALVSGNIIQDTELLSLRLKDGSVIKTQLVGAYNFPNVMAALAVGSYFKVPVEKAVAAIAAYLPSNNRSQRMVKGSNVIILDAYNANPSSMEEALQNFGKTDGKKKVMILGEMMEMGEYAQAEHQRIAEIAAQMAVDVKVVLGAGFSFLRNDARFVWFDTRESLKHWFDLQHFENTTMLIKGSRSNGLEKLLQ